MQTFRAPDGSEMMSVNMTALNITELLLTHPRFLGATKATPITAATA